MAIMLEADKCGDGAEDPMPCCEDTSEQLKVDDVVKVSFDFKSNFTPIQISFTQHFGEPILLPSSKVEEEYQFYDPPLPDPDLQIRYQIFLI